MSINYRKLGQKIKQFRLTKGLSQEELAEKCNLSTSYISYIETGKKKINFSQLEKDLKSVLIPLGNFFTVVMEVTLKLSSI